jgi:diadenosine tetraphosphatase ApaH/serine/threonine PP2A family protein phosphatase
MHSIQLQPLSIRAMTTIGLDIDQVLSVIQAGDRLDEVSVRLLLEKLREILYSEGNVLELTAPITICGDIHGQLYDLFELFRVAGSPPDTKFLFMGDYVDRGYYSVETFCYLAALKVRYPDSVYLLRGNHESRTVNQLYGFFDDCVATYGHPGIWLLCNQTFDLLPMASLVQSKIFSVHGGLSPDVALIGEISLHQRQRELQPAGPFCDLCWSDPDWIAGWAPNGRGAGYVFGSDPVREFCHNNKIDLITRAHQLAMDGFEYMFDNHLITVWSAPNYMYRSGNQASVLGISAELEKRLTVFNEVAESDRRRPDQVTAPYFA